MNDFDPTLDELVSAYLDGEATAEERARVEGDPALLERVETFRHVHEAVAASPVAANADLQRLLIARALRETGVADATVHSLRARRVAAVAKPLAIAAAFIAAFIGFAAVVSTNDRDNGGASTAASGASASLAQRDDRFAAESGGMDAASAPNAAAATTRAATPSSPGFLGRFADDAALRQGLLSASTKTAAPQTDTTAQPGAATSGSGSASVCPGIAETTTVDSTVYRAELGGRSITIVVTGPSAVVFDDTTCTRTVFDLGAR